MSILRNILSHTQMLQHWIISRHLIRALTLIHTRQRSQKKPLCGRCSALKCNPAWKSVAIQHVLYVWRWVRRAADCWESNPFIFTWFNSGVSETPASLTSSLSHDSPLPPTTHAPAESLTQGHTWGWRQPANVRRSLCLVYVSPQITWNHVGFLFKGDIEQVAVGKNLVGWAAIVTNSELKVKKKRKRHLNLWHP